MELLRSEDFWRWAAGVGIGLDPEYAEAGQLALLARNDHARFWELPSDPAVWPHFAASLLEALDEWDTGLLWPRWGQWPDPARSQSRNDGVRDVVLRGAGVPGGWEGAVRFRREEEPTLLAILFSYLAFGWCVRDDLYFVPDHGRQLLMTSHHDVIHAEGLSEERVQWLVADMAEAGYDLPTEPPDWTFKRPAWMGSGRPADEEAE
jgi:hypothetical protein